MPDIKAPKTPAHLHNLPWKAGWVTAVTFAGDNRVVAGNQEGDILMWELPDKQTTTPPLPVRRLQGHTNQVTSLATLPDGRIISTSLDKTIRVWDLKAEAKTKATVALIKATRNSKKTLDATVAVQSPAKTLAAHKEWIRGSCLRSDGKQLLTGDDSGVAILWDLPDFKESKRLVTKGWLIAVALSHDGKQAATCNFVSLYGNSTSAIGLWDIASGKEVLDLKTLFDKKARISGMAGAAFSIDGKTLALGDGGERGGTTGKIHLLDLENKKKIRELTGHQEGITGLRFHPDGKHLLSCGRDTVVRIWTIADGKVAHMVSKPRGGQFKDWVHAFALTSDCSRIAMADMAGQVQVWRLDGDK